MFDIHDYPEPHTDEAVQDAYARGVRDAVEQMHRETLGRPILSLFIGSFMEDVRRRCAELAIHAQLTTRRFPSADKTADRIAAE